MIDISMAVQPLSEGKWLHR